MVGTDLQEFLLNFILKCEKNNDTHYEGYLFLLKTRSIEDLKNLLFAMFLSPNYEKYRQELMRFRFFLMRVEK